jgi:hypothetical protein
VIKDGFGLVIRFINNLLVVTKNNYNTFTVTVTVTHYKTLHDNIFILSPLILAVS